MTVGEGVKGTWINGHFSHIVILSFRFLRHIFHLSDSCLSPV
jgi:hypothetical protein